MNTRLLRRLRKEAREKVTLIPWKLDGPNIKEVVVQEDNKYMDLLYIYGKKKRYPGDGTYYYQDVKIVAGTDTDIYGYSFEEGLDLLKRYRREYILHCVQYIKTRNRAEQTRKFYDKAKEKLTKY